jgi:hypothetical protein
MVGTKFLGGIAKLLKNGHTNPDMQHPIRPTWATKESKTAARKDNISIGQANSLRMPGKIDAESADVVFRLFR